MKQKAPAQLSLAYKSPLSIFLCGAVLALSVALFLSNLSTPAFQDYDEAIYADVAQSTALSGDPITLSKEGSPWFEKPPLYFWLAIGANKIFNDVEFAYRFPAALSGVLAILLVMLIVLQLTRNYYGAALSGVILLTTGLFLEAGHQVRLDVPVVMAVLFALHSFLLAQKNPKWYLGVGVGIAVGVLFKSVIGLFAGVYIVIWAIVEKNFLWLRSWWFWGGMLLSAALILPWHIYEFIQHGKIFWDVYFYQHVLGRYAENILGGTGVTSGEYVKYSSELAFPWIHIFLVGMFLSARDFWKRRIALARQEVFFAVIALFTYAIFLVAGTKLIYYLLPVFPFVAIFLGLAVTRLSFGVREKKVALVILTGLLVLGGLWNGLSVGFRQNSIFATNQLIANNEREVGLILAERPENWDVYTFNYPYWDTIHYYSEGRELLVMQEDQEILKSIFLIMPKELFEAVQFPEPLKKAMETLYTSESVVLIAIDI